MISNVNADDVSRKRKAKGTKTKSKKSRNDKPTETHETTEPDEMTGPEETTTPIETTTDDDVLEHRIQQICDSPQYIPTAEFSDCEETVIPEEDNMTPIQSHANVDLITFDVLNPQNVQKLIQERDRLEFGNLRRRHTLLHQLDRTQWPVLFTILQLHGSLPFKYNYETKGHFQQFKLLLYTREDEVLQILKKQYPSQKSASVVDLCAKVIWCIDPRFSTYLSQYGKVKSLTQQYNPTIEEQQTIVNYWKTSWDSKVLGPVSVKSQLKQILFSPKHMANLDDFLKNLLKTLFDRAEMYRTTVHLGEQYDFREYSNKKADNPQKPTAADSSKKQQNKEDAPKVRDRCDGCNNKPATQKEGSKCVLETRRCIHFKHPDFNRSGPWNKSAKAKKYRANGQFWLRSDKKLSSDGKIVDRKSEEDTVSTPNLSSLSNMTTNSNNSNLPLIGSSSKPEVILELITDEGKNLEFDALIDPGSYSIDKSSFSNDNNIVSYVSESLASKITNKISKSKENVCTCTPSKTCTPTGCFISTSCITVTCRLKDSLASTDKIQMSFRIVKALNDNQLIIGMNDVRKFDLTKQFRHLFVDEQLIDSEHVQTPVDINQSLQSDRQQNNSPSHEEGEDEGNHSQSKPSRRANLLLSPRRSQRLNPTGIHSQLISGSLPEYSQSHASKMALQLNNLLEGKLIKKDELLTKEDDTDYIDDYFDPNLLDDLYNIHEIDKKDLEETNLEADINNMLKDIQDEELRSKLESVVYKYTNVFSKELSSQAALVEPYKIPLKEVNEWLSDKNRHPPRWQTIAKSYEVENFIRKAIACNMIRPSDAPAWSQILLTPKKNGSYRFCVDFRALNNATHSSGWPLPNIKHVLDRIAKKKPKYFTVLDLTSGYFQIPIDEASRKLTAFRTAKGLFEWLRLPMGLKGAGSYFQMQMTKIFEDLLYNILEIYLDDILIFAETKEELVENTTIVLERLRKHNITVNPEKVKMGLTEIEYVGHLIDRHGISFTNEKKNKVLDFRLPEKAHEMKSFLGLCSQYRDHIPHYAQLSAPLHDMISNYSKKSRQKLQWNDELLRIYEKFKSQVENCGKLFFVDEDKPIFLNTDASNHGIGASLYQLDEDNKKIPIQFISKKLNTTELGWNIVEKEMYSIFYSIMKLDHLLRDQYFILQTDSKILSHMNTDHKDKVKRWKIAIQHFNFDVLHIDGKDNIEADALSRLVPFPSKETTNVNLSNLEQSEMIESRRYLPKRTFKKIQQAHNGLVGHSGVQKTIERLQKLNSTWSGMRNDVSTFIHNCPCCQKMSKIKPLIQTTPFTLAHYRPMNRICVDAIGPINIEGQKIQHIFVMIDAFSRYTRLFPLESINSKEVLTAFNSWIADFGCPSEIVSDNASYFVSELTKSFVDFAKIQHSTIHPYSHEENGLVERANQEVIRHLTAIIADEDVRKNFPAYLPFIQRIINSQVNARTSVSPTQLIFGNTINHDSHFLSEPLQNNLDKSAKEYMSNMLQIQQKILSIAQQSQEQNDTHYIVAQENKGNFIQTHFPINSYVLVEYETRKDSKLHTKRHGPYRVINRIGTVYTLENLVTNKLRDYHVKLLSQYNHDDVNVDINAVAKIDEELADITQVLSHRFKGSKKTLTNLELLLVWEDDPKPQWFPWNSSFRSIDVVHRYFENNQMRKFIPPEFTWGKDHPEYSPPKRSRNSEVI